MAKPIPPETFDKYVEEVNLVVDDWKLLQPPAVVRSKAKPFVLEYCMNVEDRPALLSTGILASGRSAFVWDGLKELAREYLRRDPLCKRVAHLLAPDQLLEPQMPDLLRYWLDDVLSGKRKKPTRRGRPLKTLRDDTIVYCIDRLAEATSLPRTRGDTPKKCCAEGGSAADVVGVASGIDTYDTIRGIWKQARRRGRNPSILPRDPGGGGGLASMRADSFMQRQGCTTWTGFSAQRTFHKP